MGKSWVRFLVSIVGAALLPGLVGCATFVQSDNHQVVEVMNEDWQGIRLSVQYYQNYKLKIGMNRLYLRRSTSDIPIFIRCSNSESHIAYLSTHPSGWYVFGNIFSWGITGWLVDYINANGWNIQSSIVASDYCGRSAPLCSDDKAEK